MRLLMLSGKHPDGLLANNPQYCRWVTENGHPGHCGEDCWHVSAEAALACFGAPRD